VRIVAGSARGRRLGPVPPGTRPVSDRAREGLFSSLGHAVEGARVLDLYAGTGALGLEALSRGASIATFVDVARSSTAAITANLGRTGLGPATVRTSDAAAFVTRTDSRLAPVDLVFLDPPYETEGSAFAPVLANLGAGWLAEPGWTVVVTRGIWSSMPVIPVDWAVARRLTYGDSLVFLYREV
jgi:16S rRNA (guanine966-N2)-methyltransferase